MNSQITVNRIRINTIRFLATVTTSETPHLESGLLASLSLLQNHALTGVTSLDVYLRKWKTVTDLRIGRRLEDWTSIRDCTSIWVLHIYMADWDPIIKRGWEPIRRFNPRHSFVSVQSQEMDFQRHMLWSPVLCSMRRGEGWLFVLLILVELLTITV